MYNTGITASEQLLARPSIHSIQPHNPRRNKRNSRSMFSTSVGRNSRKRAMSPIERLPAEVVGMIASCCRANSTAPGGDLAAWCRTNRHFRSILNPLLYHWNLERDHPLASCALWAGKEGRLETLRVAIEHGADINANGSENTGEERRMAMPSLVPFVATCLQYALKHGHQHIVDFLLDKGADPHIASRQLCLCPMNRFSPYALHTALVHSTLKGAAELIVRKTGAYLIAQGRPALEAAEGYREIDSDQTALIDLLVELPGADESAATLHWAVANANLDLATRVLTRPDVDASFPGLDGKAPIHRAVDVGRVDILQALLKRSEVNAGACDDEGRTPLHYAVRDGQLAIARVLLARADVDASAPDKKGITPLHLALTKRNLEVVTELLGHCVLRVDTADEVGRTPLHIIATIHWPDNSGLAKALLERPEASLASQDHTGQTAIHYACKNGQGSLLEMFRQRPDFTFTMTNNKGQTPLHCAAFGKLNPKQLEHLVRDASDSQLAAVDVEDRTILHYMARNCDSEAEQSLVKTIISRGVPVDHQSTYGTAFHVAIESGNLNTAETLLSCGANLASPHDFARDYTLMHHLLRWDKHPSLQTRLVDELTTRGASIDNYTEAEFNQDELYEFDPDGGEQDPGFGSDGTELFFAAAGAKNLDCMRLLLEAGADPSVYIRIRVPVDRESDTYDEDDEHHFLTALLRHEGARTKPIEEIFTSLAPRIILLLQYGVQLGRGGVLSSPLEIACEYFKHHGFSGLLDLYLDNATRKNIRPNHVQYLIRDSESDEVKDKLRNFLTREFSDTEIANSGYLPDGYEDEESDED